MRLAHGLLPLKAGYVKSRRGGDTPQRGALTIGARDSARKRELTKKEIHMSEEFGEGDVVQLKSGGPAMTVVSADSDECMCKWFRGANLERGYFELHALKLYIPPKKND